MEQHPSSSRSSLTYFKKWNWKRDKLKLHAMVGSIVLPLTLASELAPI
jgi:hypothetical protein